jgi:hypothetical protein
MKIQPQEPGRVDSADEKVEVEVGRTQDRKQIYLRTVYPANPGIPHYPDVPGGWG